MKLFTLSVKRLGLCNYHQKCNKSYSSNISSSSNSNKFVETINQQKEDSRRLILIENLTTNPATVKNNTKLITKNYLAQKLNIKIDHHWTWMYRRRNFILIQLNQLKDVNKLQSMCGYNLHALPVRTRMLEACFDASKAEGSSNKSDSQESHEFTNNARKPIILSEVKKSMSNQQLINHLTEMNTLSELDVRLRYFLITQLEDILCQSVFSDFKIYPFGSSLAGLGDSTSDLDLVLLHSNHHRNKEINFSMPDLKSERDQTQQCLSLIADIVRNFTPNFSKVNRILRARVPIVKTSFDLAPIDIDVSIELSADMAHHGLIMANYLDDCVSASSINRQFLIFIKYWAKQHSIVKNIAGNWFSNFQILTLAFYHLQCKKLIKPICDLNSKPNKKEDINVVGEEESPQIMTTQQPSTSEFIKLLYEFFEFLISFDFDKNAISILNGKSFPKPDYAPLYVENPTETNLNVCKNVSGVEFKKFLLQAYNSLDAMHCKNFHLADLLDPEYFKVLEKQQQQQQNNNQNRN